MQIDEPAVGSAQQRHLALPLLEEAHGRALRLHMSKPRTAMKSAGGPTPAAPWPASSHIARTTHGDELCLERLSPGLGLHPGHGGLLGHQLDVRQPATSRAAWNSEQYITARDVTMERRSLVTYAG